MNEKDEKELLPIPPEGLGQAITEIIRPIMQTIGQMLEHNAEALDRLSAAQSVQNDRLEALEKQIRLQTPITSKQISFLNAAIKKRARELLDKKNVEDAGAIRKLSGLIRKAVLMRYGIGNIREIPRHEYTVALAQIDMWSDPLAVRDVLRSTPGIQGREANK